MTTATVPEDRLKEELLRTALAELLEGREEGAAAVLSRLVDRHLDLDARPSDLTWHVFAAALAKRLSREPAGINLYLRRFDLSQISLFNLLTEHLPIVSIAGALANEVLAALVRPGEPIALLDVGVGTGQQEVALIRRLAAENRLPSVLHMLAVEPSESSLHEAERGISAAAAEAGLELTFTPLCGLVEHFDDVDWAALRDGARGARLLVNAAFAVHHVLGVGNRDPVAARETLMRSLATLAPAAVVLCEPHSDHQEPDLRRRFDWCLWHYGRVFRLIDRLDVDEQDRAAMKLFFAREVDDVLANADELRCERHEPSERWLARLEAAGLQPAQGFETVTGDWGRGVEVQARRGLAGICIDGDLLVAVLCAGTEPPRLELSPVVPGAPAGHAGGAAGGARIYSPAAARRVREVMTTDVATVGLDATMAQAARIVWRTRASDLAVLDADGRFAGVLSEGDLIRRLLPTTPSTTGSEGSVTEAFDTLVLNGHHAAHQSIEPLVIRDAITLKPTDDLLMVAHEMVSRQIRRLPVVTDEGRLVGSISRADLCTALLPAR